MDPLANLNEQRVLAARIVGLIDSRPSADDTGDLAGLDEHTADLNEQIADAANELAELVLALDDWRTRGGFDPYLPPEKGRLPTHKQMLALGRLMRDCGATGAVVGIGGLGLPKDYLSVTLRYPTLDYGGIAAAGIDVAGDVST
jgi:hypothetical protein